MPYTALENITSQLSEATVIQLTDDEDLNLVNSDRVDEAIVNADAVVDGYCSTRYVVPFNPVPAIIAKCSLDMAIYNLYARRVETMPDVRDKNNANALKMLQSISKGDVMLGGSAVPPPAQEQSRSASFVTQPRQLSRDTMRGL